MTERRYTSHQTTCKVCPHRVGNLCYAREQRYTEKAGWQEPENDEPRVIDDIEVRAEWCPGFDARGDFVHPCPSEQCKSCAGYWAMSGESNGGPGMMGGCRIHTCGEERIFPTVETDRVCPFYIADELVQRPRDDRTFDGPAVDPEVVDLILKGINEHDLTFWHYDHYTYNSIASLGWGPSTRPAFYRFTLDMRKDMTVTAKIYRHIGSKHLSCEVSGIVEAKSEGGILTLSGPRYNTGYVQIPIIGQLKGLEKGEAVCAQDEDDDEGDDGCGCVQEEESMTPPSGGQTSLSSWFE